MKPKMVEIGRGIRVGDLSLTVVSEVADAGKDKRVYKVKDQHGAFYVYKHIKRRSVKKEIKRTAAVQKTGVPYAKMVSSGSDYVLRQWIEGVRGDEWLKSWEAFGASVHIDAVEDLFLLLDTVARQGLYIGKIEPEDMIFCATYPAVGGVSSGGLSRETRGRWVIVNCGRIKTSTPRGAAERYFWKIFSRWGEKFDRRRDSFKNLFAILSPLGTDYPEAVETLPLAGHPAFGGTSAGGNLLPLQEQAFAPLKVEGQVPPIVSSVGEIGPKTSEAVFSKSKHDDSSGELDDEDEDDDDDDDDDGTDDGEDDSSGELPDSEPESEPPSAKTYPESLVTRPTESGKNQEQTVIDVLGQPSLPDESTETGQGNN